MIRPAYAIKLARTKLKSKRAVLFASVIVASLFFATLVATVIVFAGAEKSASEFITEAGNNRYLVKTSPNIPYESVAVSNPPSLEEIREIRAFEKTYYENLKNNYKLLGLTYNKTSEVSTLLPAAWMPETLPEDQRVSLNWASPVVAAINTAKYTEYTKTATNKFSDLKKIGIKYRAEGYYVVDRSSNVSPIPGLRLIQNNKENFGDSELKSGDSSTYGYYVNSIHNGTYSLTDQKLLNRYLLTNDASKLNGIPVVVSAQEAASLFGEKASINSEPVAADKKLLWLKEIQSKLNGQIYQACYRNSAEQILLEKIQRDYAEIKSNEGIKGYQKPSLIYDYPTEVCGNIILKSDTRTALEKQTDAETEDIAIKLGTYIAPQHYLTTFQIVGIKYAQPYTDYSKGVNEYVESLLVSQEDYSSNIDIPLQMYESLPEELKIKSLMQQDLKSENNDDFASRVLEFATVADARSFLENETCSNSSSSCNKNFRASPYGSNYLILDEIAKLFNRTASIAFPTALGLAAIIVWFTISRIMAENRRETAVYRAMGAKRSDVTAIYIVYILIIALRIAVISSILGIIAAFAINQFYGKTLTDTAVAAFGIVDNAPSFSLFSLESPLLLLIIVSIFIISIVASIQPLIRNVLRSPIQDMRQD